MQADGISSGTGLIETLEERTIARSAVRKRTSRSYVERAVCSYFDAIA